jgi:hypothetical protein
MDIEAVNLVLISARSSISKSYLCLLLLVVHIKTHTWVRMIFQQLKVKHLSVHYWNEDHEISIAPIRLAELENDILPRLD